MPTSTESERAIARLVIGTCQGRVNVTVSLPTNLRDAAAIAVDELDAASTIADLLVKALREYLESVMIPAPQFERKDKNVKPNLSLAQDTATYAEEVQSPFACDRDGIWYAAYDIVNVHPGATPADVLLWMQAQHMARYGHM
jgi:hypothetical protein